MERVLHNPKRFLAMPKMRKNKRGDKKMKTGTEFKSITIAESFSFPFAVKKENKKINLEQLAIKIQNQTKLKIKIDETLNLLNVSSEDLNCNFNVFDNGKVRVWHSTERKVILNFLDYFYFSFIEECLGDKL
jgi:hypothetical protein